MKRLVVAVVVLGACSEPTIPARTSTYGFDFAGDVFRWPQSRLPVRYFADTAGSLDLFVERALGLWQNQLLYGEFRGVLVADSNAADVIVTWTDSVPPAVPPDTGPPVFACDGVTTFLLDSAGTAVEGPVHSRIGITTAQVYSAEQVAACVRRTTVHELGHTVGLLQESPATADVMFTTVQVSAPSGRDRQTVQVLYHTPATIAPPPR